MGDVAMTCMTDGDRVKPTRTYAHIKPSLPIWIPTTQGLKMDATGTPLTFISLGDDNTAVDVADALQLLPNASNHMFSRYDNTAQLKEALESGAVTPGLSVPICSCSSLNRGAFTLGGSSKGITALRHQRLDIWAIQPGLNGWHQVVLLRQNAGRSETIARQLGAFLRQ